MIVMKFGGTSLGDRERIETVVSLVKARLARKPVLVCSAHSLVTDLLLEGARAAAAGRPDVEPIAAREREVLESLRLPLSLVADDLTRLSELFQGLALLRELTPRSLDHVAAFGERMCVKAIAALLRRRRIAATPVMADEAGLVTDGRFTRAAPLPEAYDNLAKSLRATKGVPVVTGFIGRDRDGNVTTLGRSGSDYTATILGRALGAEEVQIWKDVDGVLTADPRLVPRARPVDAMSYAEASELAYYGAKVIHPSTIHPTLEKGIPVRILNTFRPDASGTVVLAKKPEGGAPVTSIASKRGIRLVNIVSARMLGQSGFMAGVFEAFRRHDVVIDLIATSEVSVTVSVDRPEGLDAATSDIRAIAQVEVEHPCALVAVVGEGIGSGPGVAAPVFAALAQAGVGVRAISYGATKTNLQVVVAEADATRAVKALHAALFERA
ncbi:MAG TPA: aspartate kinase [Planctomycetota bacterium]|nr:aspartate kinase [Planctomycetota bacterium]